MRRKTRGETVDIVRNGEKDIGHLPNLICVTVLPDATAISYAISNFLGHKNCTDGSITNNGESRGRAAKL
jgi:hypothetical protein